MSAAFRRNTKETVFVSSFQMCGKHFETEYKNIRYKWACLNKGRSSSILKFNIKRNLQTRAFFSVHIAFVPAQPNTGFVVILFFFNSFLVGLADNRI